MQPYNTRFPHNISVRINGGTERKVFSQVTMLWLTFLGVGVLESLFACECSRGAQCHTFLHLKCSFKIILNMAHKTVAEQSQENNCVT
jgi:hypothetical protein